MRRVSSAVLLALLLAACGKETATPVTPPEEGVICFGDCAVDIETETKAYSAGTVAAIRGGGFGCACVTSQGATVFNEKSVWDSGKGVYLPVNSPYYYPTQGSVSFYAVHPASSAITLSSGAASLSWPENPDVDLLTAKKTGVTGRPSVVDLEFGHALSLMRFKAVGSDAKVDYRVKSVSVTAPASGTYAYASGSWTPSSATTAVPYYSGAVTLSGTTDIPGAVTVIPSTPSVKVEWDCLSDGAPVGSYSETKALPKAVLPGQECTVTLKLPNKDAVGIVLDLTITDWQAASQDVSFGE